MEKKYQIFISSTYKDLIEARSKVRDAILSMMHFPVGMEMFNAADEEQWEIIQETIDSSDYYPFIQTCAFLVCGFCFSAIPGFFIYIFEIMVVTWISFPKETKFIINEAKSKLAHLK